MLPDALISTYCEYKKDTDSIATWLASTAKLAGFPDNLLSSTCKTAAGKANGNGGRLKGKARSEAKKKASRAPSTGTPQKQPPAPTSGPKYTIAIKDFVVLAEFLLEHSVPVPHSFSAILDRVIASREGFGSKIEAHGENWTTVRLPSMATLFRVCADMLLPIRQTRLIRYTTVLQQVRRILTALMPNTDDTPVAPPSIDNLSNKFHGLAVYEPSEEFLNAPDVERPTRAKDDPNTYEAEAPSSLEDALFALVAILNDMDRMRSRVEWIWSNYRIGLFDITSAAIATNTAIELVRGMMDDVLPIFDAHGGYHRMLHKFYIFQCLSKGFAVEDLFAENNPKDNFNYDTYDVAESVYLMAYRYLEAFAAILEPNEVPIYKDGIFGTYDPSSDRSTKTGLAKFRDDRALVMPYFTELMTIVMGVPNWPIEDEFLRGMGQIHKTKQIPFYAVFATQVFLDISYTLGEHVDSAYDTMVTHTNFISNDIKQHFSFHKDLRIVNWPESNDRVLRNVQSSIEWLAKDPLLQVQNKLYQRMGWGSRPGAVHRLFRMSPIMSGLTLYFFRSQYHEIGLSLADAWGSLQYCEHLYNAAQQCGHLSERWTDMDVVKALLDADSFYVGSETPRTPDEQFKKFCLQMGVSAAAFSKDRRKGKRVASKAGPRGIKPNAPVHYMFAPRYREKVAFSITAEQLDQIIDLSMYEEELDEEGGLLLGQIEDSKKVQEKKRLREQHNKGIRRKGATGGSRMAAEHMIKLLAFALHAETAEFLFPYSQMHRWCWRLLRAVKEACDPLLRQIYGPNYLENETELPFVVGYVLLLASGADGAKQTMQPLEEAARALQEMVEAAGDFVTNKVLGEILGIPVNIVESDE